MLKSFYPALLMIAAFTIVAGRPATALPATSATPAAIIPTTKTPPKPKTTRLVPPIAITTHPATSGTKLNVAGPPPTPAQIQRWIHALASDKVAICHRAERKLFAAGDAAIPAMKTALQGLTTPEMRHLISKITNLDYLRGPLITLHVKNISAQNAFQQICKQAGTTANGLQQGNLPDVSLHVTNAPFWQVMQQMAELTKVSPTPWYNQNNGMQLGLNGVLNRGDFISVQGAFAVVAQSITVDRTLVLNQPGHPTGSFILNMYLLTIPGKTGPLQAQTPDFTKAVDNHGNSLLVPPQPAPFQSGWFQPPMSVHNLNNATLKWPHKPGTRITTLKGYVPVLAMYHIKTLNLKIKAKGSTHQTVHGVRFSVGHLQKVNGLWQFKLTIALPTVEAAIGRPTAMEQTILNQVLNFYGTIYSKAGTVVNPAGWPSAGNWQQGMVYTITIQAGFKPARLTVPVFTRQRVLKIPFNLKNIPMP